MSNKTTSRTRKVGPAPIIGGFFGQKSHQEVSISDGKRTRTGAGRTASEAERNASRKWGKG